MRIVIFSDTHLNLRFDEKKFNFLKRIIQNCDQVIIAGDFWEGFNMTFDEFINSPWKKLFPLLLKKNTVYVYGNHDLARMSNKKVSLFSKNQTHQYKLKIGNKIYLIEHGHRFLPLADNYFLKYFGIFPPASLNRVYEGFEGSILKIFGKKLFQKIYRQFNETMKSRAKITLKKNEYYIFGHSHVPEYDEKNKFVNSGFIRHGLGQYIIIDNDVISLHEEWY